MLKVFERQHAVLFIGSDSIMVVYTVGFTPECTTLEAEEIPGAFLLEISTFHGSGNMLFYGQHI